MAKQTFSIDSSQSGQRLDVFLTEKLSISRSQVKNLLSEEKIQLNQKPGLIKAGYKLKEKDVLSVEILPPRKMEALPEALPLQIIHEEKDFLVLYKPSGLVVHPAAGHFTGTLVNALLFHIKNLSGINGVLRPGIVHRLDKDTAGIMVVAKNDAAHRFLAEQFKKREVKKTYLALVHGRLNATSGEISTPFGRHLLYRKKMAVLKDSEEAKTAITRFKVLEVFEKYALLEIDLMTGRTHQIRVHMQHIGHPVVGDKIYGNRKNDFHLARQFLFAQKLAFKRPSDMKEVSFSCELPADLLEILQKLRVSAL